MLKIESITYLRNQLPILESVHFELNAGEVVLVRGENGSGKTTLLKLIAGLLPAQEEYRATLDDQPFDPRLPVFQSQLAYLGHTLGLKDDLTCMENLRFWAKFAGTRVNTSPKGVLTAIGLDGYQYTFARHLSAGQRKRLALGRLMLCPSRIWLVDEPYSNLDGEGITLVDRLLQRHISEGGTALVTSHGAFTPQISQRREIELRSIGA